MFFLKRGKPGKIDEHSTKEKQTNGRDAADGRNEEEAKYSIGKSPTESQINTETANEQSEEKRFPATNGQERDKEQKDCEMEKDGSTEDKAG